MELQDFSEGASFPVRSTPPTFKGFEGEFFSRRLILERKTPFTPNLMSNRFWEI